MSTTMPVDVRGPNPDKLARYKSNRTISHHTSSKQYLDPVIEMYQDHTKPSVLIHITASPLIGARICATSVPVSIKKTTLRCVTFVVFRSCFV